MKWLKILGRGILPILLIDNCVSSITQYTKDAYEIDFNFNNYFRVEGNVSFDEEEWNKFKDLMQEKMKNDPSYLFKILLKHKRSAELILLYAKSISNINFKEKSDEELKEIISPYFDLIELFVAYIYPDFAIEEMLSEQLKEEVSRRVEDPVKLLKCLCNLTSPIRENEASLENKELLKLKAQLNLLENEEHKELLINKHQKKFGWMSFYFYLGKIYSNEDIKKRLEKADISRLEKEEQKHHLNEVKFNKTLKEIGINDRKTLDIITLLRELSYAHTADVELASKAGYFLRPFFEEIARRRDVKIEDVW
ncbi:MAG: hypothetical protein OEL87_03840, partial [Nanoarchaeota archaeon]|nr:hypothetical protein [Nanoarchaeota archaeon]